MSIQEKSAPAPASTGKKSLAERIASLTPEQRALYERKRRELQKEEKPRIPRLSGAGPWPATTDQSALWFIQQLEPSTSAYNIGNGFRVKGNLDPVLLERCLNIVAERHEILRSVFKEIDGRPYQIVTDMKLTVPVTDVSHEPDPVAAAHAAVTRLIREPFDLEKGPPLRLPLVRIAEDDHVFVGVLHHIVTDWWSYYIFYNELFGIYHALEQRRPIPFRELPIQYADWAAWRDQWEKTPAFEEQENYWLRQVQGATYVLEVPADRLRPPVQTHSGARQAFDIPSEIGPRLRAMNRRAGTSSFMTLLAALDVFLWRYSGEEQFLVGTPVSADRDSPETANLIGYMLNTLVLRADLSGNPTFFELLERVRTTCIGAFANKEYPFRHLVDRLKLERDMSRMPLYQVEYLYISTESPLQQNHGTYGEKLELPGFEMTDFGIDRKTSPVDLQITLGESLEGLNLMFEYNTDIFGPETVLRLGQHLIGLLDGLLREPERPIATIPLLADSERNLIDGLNPRARNFPVHNLIDLFAAQVARTPQETAVIFEGKALTYSELNRQSNRLACYLQKAGIGPGSLVGICVDRSIEMLVAMLAVLKAGAAWLPLDPEYPEARLAYMLSDAEPAAVLTTESLRSHLPQDAKLFVLDSRELQAVLRSQSADNISISLLPCHPAYVIYTSGSTGKPKGVVIEHRALSAFLHAMSAEIAFNSGDANLAVTTIGFDISILELFLPLCHGARVVIASREDARDPARLCRLIRSSNVNSMQATPSHWNAVLQQDPDCLHGVRILSGGEALPRELAELLHRISNGGIWNVYGPTEATIWASTHKVDSSDFTEQSAPIVTIGRPLPNYRMYVLDSCLEPRPVGVSGDLYIAGEALARGYLNRPALTAERFVADPFSDSAQRMYRTGDLAQWRAGGTLEFLGRADQQIKLRGFRIELGEIEAALKSDPAIAQAAVIVREDLPGNKQLVAYLVPANGNLPDDDGLRRNLSERLPDYMVPSAFVSLDALPLTPNGKIDRRALPAPERKTQSSRGPRTPEEEILCAVFADVLGLERVGVDDNFFTLGGHSLLATRLVSQIRATAGVDLPLRALFEAPTVAQLAPHLQRAEKARTPLVRQARPEHVPVSHGQKRLWFIDQLEGNSVQYNMPEALRLRGELDLAALERTINAIVERHESLRTHFGQAQGEPFQVIEPAMAVHLPMDDFSGLPEPDQKEKVIALLKQEWEQPFNLSQGPLLRMRLIRLSTTDHIFLRTFHHIVSDGWSQAVFNHEFMVLYEAFHEGRNNPLEPLPVQYADYAAWQRNWLDDEALTRDLDYWKNQLADIPEQLDLPKDRPRQVRRTYAAAVCSATVSAEQLASIKRLCQSHHSTLYMGLLAAFSVLLHRYSGQADIVVGSPIANRQEAQLEQMIGFFVNSLIMRTQVKPQQSFAALLSTLRRTALDAYLHQDVPFEKLVEELSPERRLNAAPIFQVVFALQNAPMGSHQLKGLEVEAIGNTELRVRIDLEVHAVEHDGVMDLHWLYGRDLFDHWRIEQMARHYLLILEAVIENSDLGLEAIDLLSAAEKQQILEQWNATAHAVPPATFTEMFEAQVRRTPQALAAIFGEELVTYTELNARANALGHFLITQGIEPEDLVAIAVPRSIEMLVAMLGIWKAGAAYLPLDPNYPIERLSFMLQDSEAVCVLTTREIVPKFSRNARCFVLDDPNTIAVLMHSPGSNPTGSERVRPLHPRQAAYVIYTSGSTGAPKGVVVSHAGIPSLLGARIDRLELTSSSRVLQFASLSFDVSVVEIVQALGGGAALVLLRDDQRSGLPLRDAIVNHAVTHATLPPVVLPTLDDAGDLPLPTLIVGGEACSGELVAQWSPSRRMFNGYGPTETTVVVTIGGPLSGNQVPPIGTPIWNTSVYVLDQHLRPVPIGVAGELYIAGISLARGYLKRPALTAARFVANPHGQPGARMYRTGDLARWRADGNLEFLGRTDQQVKVRGFRVELGEIEAALYRHPKVQDSAVVLHEDRAGEKQLVGYVIAKQTEAAQTEAQSLQIERWQQVYDSYRQGLLSSKANLAFAGWNSSYTGEPIPDREMQIWVDETVARLSALRPHRVLEIGCGTGLLLTRLAPACESYVGIDFSAEALKQLEAVLVQTDDLKHVALRKGLADELFFAADESVDLVIINSVVQYFPGVEYLLKVLSEAVRVTQPGGHIFVGDVRSLPLLQTFHASVQLHKAPAEMSLEQLRQKINQALVAEEELTVSPALFHELGSRSPKIGHVGIAPKGGHYDNELSRFRYDVTLQIGKKEKLAEPRRWIIWDESGQWKQELQQILSAQPQISVGVRGIRDLRSAPALKASQLLQSAEQHLSNAGELRSASAHVQGEDPDAVMKLAKYLGVELCWQTLGTDGVHDVILNPLWQEQEHQSEVSAAYYRQFANSPALNTGDAKLGRVLQDHLRQSLPDYMVPTAIMVLSSWPLTPSGKIDRKALPAPERQIEGYRAPRTPQEEILCAIFADVLSLERVGIDDDFFALGGHSLMATRLVSQIRSTLGVELALRTLFEAPTVARLAPHVGRAEKVRVPLVRQPRPERLPLSYAQQRLWFIDQLEGSTSTEYNMPSALRLRGELDLPALHRAIDAIVERHESLRTHFAEIEGQPAQIISPPSPFVLPFDDLSGFDENMQRERALAAMRQEWEQPFNLAHGPVLRMSLIKLSEHDHILLRTFHHIVSDGWSVGVFSRELMQLYDAFHERRDNPLTPLPVQYADFALWQRSWLDENALARDLQYWKEQLRNIPEQLELPKDRPRQVMQTYAADVCDARLPAAQLALLKQLTHENQSTLYMTLLSAFALLLHRYSGQDDIVVGSPIANRQEAQLEQMIGFFVNSLVMRVRLNPEQSFTELLASTRSTALEAYQHQDVPFERLVEQLAPQRSLNKTPIFQVVFAVQNAPMGRQQLKGLEVEPVGGDELRVRFDLELHVFEHGDHLGFYWLYNRGLFDRWRMEQMARHYVGLLNAILVSPGAPLHALEMLSAEERRILLVEANDTASPLPQPTLLAPFEEQVSRTPSAAAVVTEESTLTFNGLNQRANRLAHHLIGLGIGPEDLVGIALKRSPELIIALLGVLKSGAAYLPLDMEVPEARLAHMISDAAPALIISQSACQSRLPGQVKVLSVDSREFQAALQQCSPHNPVNADRLRGLLPAHPVYVIYTSGSTGVPKGVVISHQGLMNYLQWSTREYGVEQGNGSPAHSSISFDLTVTAIYPALLAGKPVVIASEQHDVENLGAILQSYANFGLVKLTPAHLELLNSSLLPENLKNHAHKLVIGGEALKYELLAPWRSRAPETALINEYGPTETVVGCCVYQVQAADPSSGDVPIGRPIANTELYVLDRHLRPVPIGAPGELYISGLGVARGYLRKPALTSERFVADPFGKQGTRMYRTGDLVRWRIDGNLVFIGRADQQLKIRGFRVEPGEIEATLKHHDQVADALVTARDQAGAKQLIGYVIARQNEAAAAEAQELQISHWQQLYESTYRESTIPRGDFNLAGWTSSYTGEPIPAEEMRIWVEETVARIRALRPGRVLEIGCGSGLLLSRLAVNCESYIGLDFSHEVLAQLNEYLQQHSELTHVKLHHGLAHELAFLPDDSVDLAILNSVVQYFPSMDYLLQVLAEVQRVTRFGGHIFIGDVRSLPLLEAFHASVRLHQAPETLSLEDLRQQISHARQNEEEFLIDAAMFLELSRRAPKIGWAQAALKQGSYDNELSRFRYDVTLAVSRQKKKIAESQQWLSWDESGQWREDLQRILKQSPQSSVGVRGIRDRRVAGAVEAVRILQNGNASITNAAQLRTASSQIAAEEPDAVTQLARRLGAELCWLGFGPDGIYDAVFNPVWEQHQPILEAPRNYYRRYGNTPALNVGSTELANNLQKHLREILPDYMAPAAILVVPSWPLTANGKIDRRALPLPAQDRTDGYRSPRTPQEDLLCKIFGDVLGLRHVGIHDNFFALGGHSLMATRLVSQVRSALGIELRIRTLFEAPTVAELVQRLDVKTSPESAFDRTLPLRSSGSLPPLFCAHPAGGLSWTYAGFMRELDPQRPIYGLQAAAVAHDQPFPESVEAMAEDYVNAIRQVQPAGPYYLLGWSFGGVLAFAIACCLQQQGEQVASLTIMDSYPSTDERPARIETEDEMLREAASLLGLDVRQFGDQAADFERLFQAADRAGHIPADFNQSIARRTLQMMKHCAALERQFRPACFKGEMLFFFASQKTGNYRLPQAWQPFVTGNIEVHNIDCKHGAMTEAAPLKQIGRILDQRLRALAPPPQKARLE